MAIIKTIEMIKVLSGKIGHSNLYFSYSQESGKVSMKSCPKRTTPPTEGEKRSRERFARISAMTKEWFDQNKPGRNGDVTQEGTPEYYKAYCDFLKENKPCGRFSSYIMHLMSERYAALEQLAG